MKNNKGVTLIALVVTIIVFVIILSITLSYGLSGIHSATNKKTESELGIVQEAVMQRYALAKTRNNLGVMPIDTSYSNCPDEFVGTIVKDVSTTIRSQFANVNLLQNYTNNSIELPYEKYYYSLDENALKDLGIEKGNDGKGDSGDSSKSRSYIVNYFTGEVFDTLNKKYYKTDTQNDDPVYKQPTSIEMPNQDYVYNDD